MKATVRIDKSINASATLGGGGGSGLPSYTDADEGKVLGLAENDGSVVPSWVSGGGNAYE